MVTLMAPISIENSPQSKLQEIREVAGRLRDSGFLQLRNVNCEYHGQVLVLRGQVDSFYLKQLAQELAKKAAPQLQIANLVAVS